MRNIFVGNFPFETTEEELRVTFAEYGNVTSAKIITYRMTGQSRGYGFVEMAEDHEAEAAMGALNGKDYNGRPLTVRYAQPLQERLAKESWLVDDVLRLPLEFVKEIETLLDDKKQVIFQGPPGTGKTYVAQKLAKHLAGSDERVTLVQFHPSYAYEDFVQGFRPTTLKDGQAGFELRDGPLLKVAKRAKAESYANHFLVIDEINRGNLAKVFGELYFLLEYRDEKIRLQYQGDDEEDFSLPRNLYIIGTMNTADRSIALVDLALRRRFYFVEFHPDRPPIEGLLRRWLGDNAPGMEWVADVVERANKLLEDDRHAAIGPSYFMKQGLDEAAVERVWKHSVLPYIEERRFGGDEVTEEFRLDKLRGEVASEVRDEDEEQADGGADEGDAPG